MTIDTLKISKELFEAGLSQKVSEKLATKFKQNDENYLSKKEAKERLATKFDISKLYVEIEKVRTEIANSKYTIIIWNAGMLITLYGMLRFF